MKYLNIYIFVLITLFTFSCSDDNKELFNTSSATVAFQQNDISIKESAGLYNIPVKVDGERNGDIRVRIEVEDISAKENENYIITTKTLIIPKDKEIANFEFNIVDDEDINDNRIFKVKIVDVNGAEIGANSLLTVTIDDNDSNYYERIAGTWIFTATASSSTVMGSEIGCSVRINTATEGTPAYGHYLVCSNQNGFDPDNNPEWTFNWRLKYSYDESTNKINVYIVLNEEVASYGSYSIKFRRGSMDGIISDSFIGEYNPQENTIKFENANLIGDMYNNNDMIKNGKFTLSDCVMKKIN